MTNASKYDYLIVALKQHTVQFKNVQVLNRLNHSHVSTTIIRQCVSAYLLSTFICYLQTILQLLNPLRHSDVTTTIRRQKDHNVLVKKSQNRP